MVRSRRPAWIPHHIGRRFYIRHRRNAMPPDHRRWWDRQHRRDCRYAIPIGIISFGFAALSNGYDIPS